MLAPSNLNLPPHSWNNVVTLTVTRNNFGDLGQAASKLFANFISLKVLILSDNHLISVTDFSAMPALEHLDLSNNQITVCSIRS